MIRWAIFGVVIALIPVVFSYFNQRLDGKSPTLADLLADGELLLISTSIAATAIGDLIGSGNERLVRKLFAGGGCVVIVLFASLYFAAVKAKPHPDHATILTASLWLFVCAIVSSGSCIYLAHEGT